MLANITEYKSTMYIVIKVKWVKDTYTNMRQAIQITYPHFHNNIVKHQRQSNLQSNYNRCWSAVTSNNW